MQGMKKRLTRGAVWLAAAGALVNLTAFANTLLLARLLVPADFGLVAIATTITAIIMSVTELSLSSALIHHKNPQDDHFHSAFTLNLVRSLLIAGVILIAAAPISRVYNDPRLVNIMLVISATTVLIGLANPKLVLFSRDLLFRQDFIINVSQKVIGFAAAAIVAALYHSYWALVAGTLAMRVSALVLSYVLIPYSPRMRFSRVRELLSFSVWLSLGQAVNTLNWKFDQLAIGYFLGSSPLGYYTVGDTLSILPTREATTPLAQTLFPGFAKLTDDLPRLRQAYQHAQSVLFAVAWPIGCGFALIAKPLIILTMGKQWMPAIIIVQVLASVFAFQNLAASLQPLAMALGETRRLFHRDLVNLLIRLPLIVVGLAYDGLLGIVYARCISSIAGTLVNMVFVKNLINLPVRAQVAVNMRAFLSALVLATGTYLIGLTMGDGTVRTFLVEKIVAMVIGGASLYAITLYTVWRYVGRPPGLEREALNLLAKVVPWPARERHIPS